MSAAIIIIAKAPLPGRVKTRLSPPLTPIEAAELAAAALRDTLLATIASSASRIVVAFDGEPDPWLAGFDIDVIPQRGVGLDQRIAAAFTDVGGSALLIGMDTPQVDPVLLTSSLVTLDEHDAVLGLADDGGFWAIGVHAAHAALFAGVPMSTDRTGAAQLARLRAHGLDVARLETLRDVDVIADATAVASIAPESNFARVLASHLAVAAASR